MESGPLSRSATAGCLGLVKGEPLSDTWNGTRAVRVPRSS